MSLRILYYNWADYLDAEGRGGGVSVYQRNLIAALDRRGGVETGFFSSGLSHDLRGGAPRWEPVRHGPAEDRHRRWEIVNAAVLAPAHHAFGDPAQIAHPRTEEVICDLIARTGPWDVLHLNNLEGLPAAVLGRIRDSFPDLRIVLSLHNYFAVCPQVNLWHQERETCVDFDAGRACENCLPARHDTRALRGANALSYRLKCLGLRPGSWSFDVAFRWSLRAAARGVRGWRQLRGRPRRKPPQGPGDLTALRPPEGAPFVTRRRTMVGIINSTCDAVLCVSEAVRDLAIHYGIEPDLAQVSYIGTTEAEAWAETAPRPVPQAGDGTLTLGFLGYMRRDKGFYFLLQALESLPAPLAARLRLVVAARRGDRTTMGRLADLGRRLAEVDHADGYCHDDLDRLLGQVDIGVVPVLWHDNLPQVAIEMHARHIPLLCADMGGAQELGRCPQMVFPAGDTEAFHARIETLLAGKVDFGAYWQGAMPPVGMAAHLDDLWRHYER